jgi:hemerythrin-like domain-containing protein
MRGPDIFERLRADHQHVLEQIDALERAQWEVAKVRSGETGALLRLLEEQFATHIVAEETLLYPALERALADGGEGLAPLVAEHEELRSLLALLASAGLAANRSEQEQTGIRLRDLIDLLRIHIRKEEAAVFRVAERVLSAQDIEALTRRMLSSPHPPAVRSGTRKQKGNRR